MRAEDSVTRAGAQESSRAAQSGFQGINALIIEEGEEQGMRHVSLLDGVRQNCGRKGRRGSHFHAHKASLRGKLERDFLISP